MTLFEKIKVLLALNNELKEIQRMDIKSGWKTSEFWFSLAAQAGVLWGAVQGFVPPKVAAIVSVAGAALYTVARTILKAVSDVQAVKAASSTVTTTQPVTTITNPA